jgi:hypothetical protein
MHYKVIIIVINNYEKRNYTLISSSYVGMYTISNGYSILNNGIYRVRIN